MIWQKSDSCLGHLWEATPQMKQLSVRAFHEAPSNMCLSKSWDKGLLAMSKHIFLSTTLGMGPVQLLASVCPCWCPSGLGRVPGPHVLQTQDRFSTPLLESTFYFKTRPKFSTYQVG